MFCSCRENTDEEMDYVVRVIDKEKKTPEALVFALGELELSSHQRSCYLYDLLLNACEMHAILHQRRGTNGRTT